MDKVYSKIKNRKSDPLLSVVMGVYNREKYLHEAIESVLCQTYRKFEFFIVNDGSTDNSWEIIKSYAKTDARIKCINNRKNLGQSGARNVAIKKAKGDFIVIADSDDICTPNRFERQTKYFQKHFNKIDVLGSDYGIFSDKSKKIFDIVKANVKDLYNGKPPVHNPTCMIKRSVFKDYGYYNPKFDNAEDVELWFRWFSQGVRFDNIPKVLYKKREHEGCVSKTRIRSQDYLMLKINIIAVTKYRLHFTFHGYLRILEQFFYLIYLSLRLDKIYVKKNKYT